MGRLRSFLGRSRQRVARWLSGRRLVLATACCAATGLFTAGVATGWWAADQLSPRSSPDVVVTVPAGGASAGATSGAPDQGWARSDARSARMPDLRGLTEADARQVLQDLGLAGVAVTVDTRPAVAPTGTVVAHDPAGAAPIGGTVVLTLAAPAVVPEVVGAGVTDAVRQVEELGARVRVTRVFDAGAGVDEVLDVEPAAGETITGEVLLTVAAPASDLPLTELRPIDGGCRTATDVQTDGVRYAEALWCDRLGSSGASAVYLLNRGIAELTAVTGQADDSEPGDRVRVEVLVDEEVRFSEVLGWGESAPVSVDTSGALRLELRVTPAGDDGFDGRGPAVVFADPALRGGPDAVQALLAGQ